MENLEKNAPATEITAVGAEANSPTDKGVCSESGTPGASGRKPDKKGRAIVARIFAVAAVIVVILAVLIACKDKKKDPDVINTAGDYTSPTALAMSEDGQYLYVADATGKAVYKMNASDGTIADVYQSELSVQDVAVAGDSILVAEGALGGKLVKLDSSMEVKGSLITGHTPTDILVLDGKAYVANRFSNTVSCVDVSSMSEDKLIAVGREPVTLTLAGSDLYVGCLLTDDVANKSNTCAKVCVIDTASNEHTDTIDLCNGAGSIRGVVATNDGKFVYVSHVVAHYQLPTTQLDGGWINTNAISVIDTSTKKVQYAFTLDDVELGAANPWGVAISDDDESLYVALSGTNEIMRVNLKKMANLLKAVKNGNSPLASSYDDIINHINFATDAKARISLGAEVGVRSLLISDGTLYAAEYFAGKVAAIDTKTFKLKEQIVVKEQPEADDVRLGEIYWYDATLCYQKWQSCNSCHPDVRADGFNWDNLNDGLGTSKQAKSMLYSYRTPPVMITGIRANAEVATVAGFRFICFNDNYSDYAPKIDAFLKALQPVQSPYLNNDGTLTAAAQHGSELFLEYGCAECHPAPLYTDLEKHLSVDLELGDDWENREFDTPTLVEVWRTMPWAFNGYYNDMAEYVKFMCDKHGKPISDADAKDLAEFVLSIGAENEYYGVVQVINEDTTYNVISEGSGIKSISFIKQIAGAPNGKAVITVYDESGKALGSSEIALKDMAYGVVYQYDLDKVLSTSGASYYTVTIKDGDGKALASDLKFN